MSVRAKLKPQPQPPRRARRRKPAYSRVTEDSTPESRADALDRALEFQPDSMASLFALADHIDDWICQGLVPASAAATVLQLVPPAVDDAS